MQITLPDVDARAIIEFEDIRIDDAGFYELCQANPGLRIERAAEGEIVIMPPAGAETGYRNSDLASQLHMWARRDGRGVAFDSSTGYFLPDGSARSPDASWILKSRLEQFTKAQKRNFLPLCPDFVVELTSPTDRVGRVQDKMREWMNNGAQFGCLLDSDRRAACVYRPGHAAQVLEEPDRLAGEGVVDGFVLELADIWAGL